MNEEEYQKLKALKEKYNISWNELVKCANKLLSGGMKNDDTKK